MTNNRATFSTPFELGPNKANVLTNNIHTVESVSSYNKRSCNFYYYFLHLTANVVIIPEKRDNIPLEALIEEDEFVVTAKIITDDSKEIPDDIDAALSKGVTSACYKRLYEAAQAKVMANAEFEKAKAEVLNQIRQAKASPARKPVINVLAGSAISVNNPQAQRQDSVTREGRRIVRIPMQINEIVEQRKRTISIIK